MGTKETTQLCLECTLVRLRGGFGSPELRVETRSEQVRNLNAGRKRLARARQVRNLNRGIYVALLVIVFGVRFPAAHAQRRSGNRPSAVQTAASDSNALSPLAKMSLDAAVSALQSNTLPEAERHARAAVAASPRSAVTHNVLGVVLDRSGQSDEAYKEFGTAIRLDPNFVSARNNLGRMLAEHGKRAEAIAEFERVLKSDPNHVQAHYNLGALYADAGDFLKATDHLASARRADPNDPQLALAFLNVAYRANRTAEAD